jgi:uncharacterized protein YndB with AHSA1/START domain
MRRYRFQDEWTAPAPPAEVWKLIGDPTSYPRWWPIYQEARFLEDRGGPGSRILLRFRVLLPYSLTIVSTITRSDEPRFSEGTLSGELEGTWRWTLAPLADGGTRVAFEEEVGTNKRALDLLAPIAHKLFELNHRVATQRGARGMQAYFARGGSRALPSV